MLDCLAKYIFIARNGKVTIPKLGKTTENRAYTLRHVYLSLYNQCTPGNTAGLFNL